MESALPSQQKHGQNHSRWSTLEETPVLLSGQCGTPRSSHQVTPVLLCLTHRRMAPGIAAH